MSPLASSCTGSISVLLSDRQTAIQHCESAECSQEKLHAKSHKLCTVVENGRVVVRPVAAKESVQYRENACNQ
ncbi:hypothetical protein [Leptolyngbya sp. NIES-2104]|uniref:hypothetical protein n=1 Tax=Leptolyngbya sp. NIES-2104 TaxID=1552121 RepID=UPI0006EC6D61|nr:hypothetical protein [Leptolyngbya sp. NIES-2104]GAP98719.1 hypothetical protein NIES2104_52750 [Leptolyngbya sp. NIES-2104]